MASTSPSSCGWLLQLPPQSFIVCTYLVCALTAQASLNSHTLYLLWRSLLFARLVVGLYEVAEVLLSIKHSLRQVEAGAGNGEIEKHNGTQLVELLPLHIIIVAYLPNEKNIIFDRIEHATSKIIYPLDKLQIHVVYNTPVLMPREESRLQQMAQAITHLRVHKVPYSTSKAQNINHVLPLIASESIVAIFDTDHYTHPAAPQRAVRRLQSDPQVHILQGRCIPMNVTASILSTLIAVEFDMLYAVTHLGRDLLWHTAMFNGSNGYWRADCLKALRLNPLMMAEDIEVSFRALKKGCTIVHDPSVVSYELAPVTWRSFWTQRLRWAHGWTQASWTHCDLLWRRKQAGNLLMRQKMGFLVLILFREVNTHVQLQYYCGVCCMVWKSSWGEFNGNVLVAEDLVALLLSCLFHFTSFFAMALVSSPFVTRKMQYLFYLVSPLYSMLMSLTGLFGQIRVATGYSHWKPTPR